LSGPRGYSPSEYDDFLVRLKHSLRLKRLRNQQCRYTEV
jgi:hypothetical protein